MPQPRRSLFATLLWPALLTLAISVARLTAEVQGLINQQSGGAFALLGITWLVFVFGAWFALRLRRADSAPVRQPPWLWSLLPLLAVAGTAVWRFAQVDRADQSDAAFASLREHVLIIAGVAIVAAAFAFTVWPRLALTLLGYGIAARLGVLALTALAKQMEWNTHYTKFGPSGIERDFATTMTSAAIAQLVFWVSFTVVAGTFTGCVVAGRRTRAA